MRERGRDRSFSQILSARLGRGREKGVKKSSGRVIEKGAEIATHLGLAAVIGGVADAVADGSRVALDLYSVGIGIVLLVLALWLTSRIDGDKD